MMIQQRKNQNIYLIILSLPNEIKYKKICYLHVSSHIY